MLIPQCASAKKHASLHIVLHCLRDFTCFCTIFNCSDIDLHRVLFSHCFEALALLLHNFALFCHVNCFALFLTASLQYCCSALFLTALFKFWLSIAAVLLLCIVFCRIAAVLLLCIVFCRLALLLHCFLPCALFCIVLAALLLYCCIVPYLLWYKHCTIVFSFNRLTFSIFRVVSVTVELVSTARQGTSNPASRVKGSAGRSKPTGNGARNVVEFNLKPTAARRR